MCVGRKRTHERGDAGVGLLLPLLNIPDPAVARNEEGDEAPPPPVPERGGGLGLRLVMAMAGSIAAGTGMGDSIARAAA